MSENLVIHYYLFEEEMEEVGVVQRIIGGSKDDVKCVGVEYKRDAQYQRQSHRCMSMVMV